MTKNKAAVALGRKGGKVKSEAKSKAARLNVERARTSRWPVKPAQPSPTEQPA